jgi:hypothetical protein
MNLNMIDVSYLVLTLDAPVGNLTGFENLVVSVLLSFFTPARGQVLMVNSAVFVFENSKNYDLAWNKIALL